MELEQSIYRFSPAPDSEKEEPKKLLIPCFSNLVFAVSHDLSMKVLLALEHATMNESHRNFHQIKNILSSIEFSDIECLDIWKSKAQSKRASDLVSCGFISIFYSQTEIALSLFSRASSKGCEIGSFMSGLLFAFYCNDIRKSIPFFALCNENPLGLTLNGIFLGNSFLIDIAAAKIGLNSIQVFEHFGDLFRNGVSYPRLDTVAKHFYALGISHYKAKGMASDELEKKFRSLVN